MYTQQNVSSNISCCDIMNDFAFHHSKTLRLPVANFKLLLISKPNYREAAVLVSMVLTNFENLVLFIDSDKQPFE
jgi:hypothetical protein